MSVTNFAADYEKDPESLVYDTVFRTFFDKWFESKTPGFKDEIYQKAQEEREILRNHKKERISSGGNGQSQRELPVFSKPVSMTNPQQPSMTQTFVVHNKQSEAGPSNKMSQTIAGPRVHKDGTKGGSVEPLDLKQGDSISRPQPSGQQTKLQKDTKAGKESGVAQKDKQEVKPGKEQISVDDKMKKLEEEIQRRVVEDFQKRHEEEIRQAVAQTETAMREHMEKQNKELHTFYKRALEKKDDEIRSLTDYNHRAKLEIEDLNTRLSRISAQKLKAGNPNIGDLSDPIRPSELGRKFGEIYDDEWSDAFEALQKTKCRDKEAVTLLYQLTMDSYTYCANVAELQCACIRDLLISPYGQQKAEASKTFLKSLGPEARDKRRHELIITLKDSRKTYAKETAKNVGKVYVKEVLPDKVTEFQIPRDKIPEELKAYAEKCTSMSWYMVICDPPVVMVGGEVDATFDDVIFKEFQTKVTKKGDFVVSRTIWPALRLGHNGALLEKGVAEPAPKKKT